MPSEWAYEITRTKRVIIMGATSGLGKVIENEDLCRII